MFILGWPVTECAKTFEKLSKKAFKPRPSFCIPFLSRIQELIISYFADSLYPSGDLENALKDVFGPTRSLLDCSYATTIGAKVGLPVTTVPDASPCIFTNYNGVGNRAQDCSRS